MLWVEKYRPETFDEIRGQTQVVNHLRKFGEDKNVPHMLLFGPHGTGKSCCIEALAKAVYGDFADVNVSVIPAGILFKQGKTWLESQEKFSHLYEKDESLIVNFKHIVKEYASMKPFNADFKIIVFEDAGALPFDAQAALRRIMEKYSSTCRFILTARQETAIIPPIASRCLPLFFAPVEDSVILGIMKDILAKEGVSADAVSDDYLELIAACSKGDCRKGITYLEAYVKSEGSEDAVSLSESEVSAVVYALFANLKNGNLKKSCDIAEMIMIEYGLSGAELISELKKIVRREYNDMRITVILSDADYKLVDAGNEFIQINAMLARIISEVFAGN